MRPKKLSISPMLIGLVFLSVTPALAVLTTVDDISKELMCQCGCTMVLATCTCQLPDGSAEMKALIEQRLALGESQAQVLALFVGQYGEQVLATLPKSGFNLMAWLLPLAGLLFGGGVAYFTLRRWLGRGRQPPAGTMAEVGKGDDKYRGQLEKELEEFDEGGFR